MERIRRILQPRREGEQPPAMILDGESEGTFDDTEITGEGRVAIRSVGGSLTLRGLHINGYDQAIDADGTTMTLRDITINGKRVEPEDAV